MGWGSVVAGVWWIGELLGWGSGVVGVWIEELLERDRGLLGRC